MVSKCANPQCQAHLKYLHQGSLYVVPRPSRFGGAAGDAFASPAGKQIECFWLCESCSLRMRVSRTGELILSTALDCHAAQAA